MVGVLVERLRRLSKLAVQVEYGFPLSLRLRKGTKPPKRHWSKVTRSHDKDLMPDL